MSASRIKVLHVVFSLDPGGMENGLVNVAKGLDPREFEVHVCCLNRAGSFVDRLPQPENVHVLGRQEGFNVRTLLGLRKVIRKINPDVIHTHNLGPLIYSSLGTGLGFTHPILHGEHGVLPQNQCTPKRVRQRKWLYRCCRKVHTVSSGQRGQLAELGLPDSNLIVVINGVDAKRFSPGCKKTAREKIGNIPEGAIVLGIVGRFVGLKRHVELIEAFENLGAEFSNVHLLVVGGGGDEEQNITARAKSSKAAARIHLAGFQSNPLPFYQAMDLLVVPSIVEGMSNVVLEAMACGIPVLAHNACGNAEMLVQNEDGMIADLSTVQNLQQTMKKTLADREQLGHMGLRARENVVRKFSITTMIENYSSVYREIAGRSPHPAGSLARASVG